METNLRKTRAPRLVSVGSIVWALIALIAGFVFGEHRLQIVGIMCGPLGMRLNFLLLLPLAFVPASWDPHYVFAPFAVAAAFTIQWQLIAWLLYRRQRRSNDRHVAHAKA
jgi:hypothetical protein